MTGSLPPLPTEDEIHSYGPPLKSWSELKEIIGSGELGLLRRQPGLQARYDVFRAALLEQFGTVENYLLTHRLPPLAPPSPSSPTFNPSTPPSQLYVHRNDWPYSLPREVEHWVIWTSARLPDLGEKGVWGFTGQSQGERVYEEGKAEGIEAYVKQRWAEGQWETAWFVNPPRLQSVKGLAHFHVFAKPKGVDEVEREA